MYPEIRRQVWCCEEIGVQTKFGDGDKYYFLRGEECSPIKLKRSLVCLFLHHSLPNSDNPRWNNTEK